MHRVLLTIVVPVFASLASCGHSGDRDSSTKPSSGSDAASVSDAQSTTDSSSGTACTVGTEYRYGFTGASTAWTDVVVLRPPSSLTLRREYAPGSNIGPDRSPEQCTTEIPACGNSSTGLTMTDVLKAIQDPDVTRALNEDSSSGLPVYGMDLRTAGGQVFSFVRGDGRGFYVGEPCGGSDGTGSECRPIPDGLAVLEGLLLALERQQIALPPCVAFR